MGLTPREIRSLQRSLSMVSPSFMNIGLEAIIPTVGRDVSIPLADMYSRVDGNISPVSGSTMPCHGSLTGGRGSPSFHPRPFSNESNIRMKFSSPLSCMYSKVRMARSWSTVVRLHIVGSTPKLIMLISSRYGITACSRSELNWEFCL